MLLKVFETERDEVGNLLAVHIDDLEEFALAQRKCLGTSRTNPPRPRRGAKPSQRGSRVRFIGIFGALLSVALVLTVGGMCTLVAAPFRALRRA